MATGWSGLKKSVDNFCYHYEGLILLSIVLLIIVAIVGFAIYADKTSCSNYGEITQQQIKHKVFGGCFVQAGDEWLTREEKANTLMAREAFQ